MATSNSEPLDSVALAAEIVAAFVANNHLQVSELPRAVQRCILSPRCNMF